MTTRAQPNLYPAALKCELPQEIRSPSNMILRFSKHGIMNTCLMDDAGVPVYKIDTLYKGIGRTTIVRRAEGLDEDALTLVDPGSDEEISSNRDEVARIHWHLFKSTRLAYGGQITNMNQILTNFGCLARSFTFMGTDGRSYIWDLGLLGMSPGVLKLNDDSKTVVARFHKRRCCFKRRKAYLEVYESCLHMLDLLVITFLFTEKTRRRREATARALAGG